MQTSRLKWIGLGLVLLLLLSVLSGNPLADVQPAEAQAQPAIGLVCNYGPSFDLEAKPGYIVLSDGNTMFMWSYSLVGEAFQYPGPVLCVNEGDTVTITLHNTLPEDSSIMFPGQTDVLADGFPAQPQFDGSGNITSLTNVAPANGGTMTYSFVASNPGTFIYESGTDPEKQVRMGLGSALVVHPTMGPDFVYNRADSKFTPEEEFLVLFSEIDPLQHQAVEQGMPFDMNQYRVRYWLLNGRTFPDTIADNNASWVPNQPYGALARIHPYDATAHPDYALARYLNLSYEDIPMHPHGNNGAIIGRDGMPLEGPGGEDLSFEKFAINIAPGQTYDILFRWYDAENYSPANPVPITVPDIANQTIGMFYSGSPYLGVQGPMPPGVSTLNQCGEYYIINHNHALFQLDAWGMTMAGQITYLRIDPPLPNSCP